LRKSFQNLAVKIKAGVFVGPQIRSLMKDEKFENVLSAVQLSTWKSFKSVCKNFLGNNRYPEYVKIVNDLL